jgi:signal transduction histidine kinase
MLASRTHLLTNMKTANESFFHAASICHDLQSPLSAIQNVIEMLKHDFETNSFDRSQALDLLLLAESAGHDTQAIMNNMLACASLEAGKLEMSPALHSRMDLLRMSSDLLKSFQSHSKRTNIALSVSIGDLPEWVFWDLEKLRLFAINNLISNALKFNSPGGRVMLCFDSDPSGNATISIMDDGCGISPAEREGLFARFNRCAGSRRTIGGTGLGLYNAVQTVSLHGGSIDILDGIEGRGVTFRIVLPSMSGTAPSIANAMAMAAD